MLNYSLQTLGRNHQNLLNVFGIKTVKVTFEERFSAIIVIVCLVLGFIFNNDYYHWVDGVAMRSHLRLTLANLLSRYYKSMQLKDGQGVRKDVLEKDIDVQHLKKPLTSQPHIHVVITRIANGDMATGRTSTTLHKHNIGPCWLVEFNIWTNGAKKENICILRLVRWCLRKDTKVSYILRKLT